MDMGTIAYKRLGMEHKNASADHPEGIQKRNTQYQQGGRHLSTGNNSKYTEKISSKGTASLSQKDCCGMNIKYQESRIDTQYYTGKNCGGYVYKKEKAQKRDNSGTNHRDTTHKSIETIKKLSSIDHDHKPEEREEI